jgi:hypothetical protein
LSRPAIITPTKKNQPKTVIQTLAERLRDQAKRFNPSIETAR